MPRRRPQLNRRQVLRGACVSLALPFLPSLASAASAPAPSRLVTVCATLGLFADAWFPATAGRGYEPTRYLNLIDRHREKYTLFSGLAHRNQTGRQAHNSELTWLTSAEHPGLDGFKNTISLDQAAGAHFGYTTRYPSIVLGTASAQSQSWTDGGVMVPAQTSPAALFAQLFLRGDPNAVAREAQRLASGGSILDHVRHETNALRAGASGDDKQVLDAYLSAVRTAEQELTEVRAWLDRPKPVVAAPQPTDVADVNDTIGKARLMFELIPLILATDSSRSVSLMIQDHGVVPRVPGVSGEHHGLSHHGQDPAKIAELQLVETEIVTLFGTLLDRLTEPHGAGTLLDTTTVLFGSNLGNANSHSATDLPILVAGGPYAHGGHVAHEGDNAPLSNLFVTLLRGIGMDVERFGHSTGALTWS